MPRPNRDVTVSKDVIIYQCQKIKEAMVEIQKKENLNGSDIQAIKILIGVYENLMDFR